MEEKPEEMTAAPKGAKGAKVTKEAAVDTFIEAVASEAAAQPRPKLETIHSIPDAEAEPPPPNSAETTFEDKGQPHLPPQPGYKPSQLPSATNEDEFESYTRIRSRPSSRKRDSSPRKSLECDEKVPPSKTTA